MFYYVSGVPDFTFRVQSIVGCVTKTMGRRSEDVKQSSFALKYLVTIISSTAAETGDRLCYVYKPVASRVCCSDVPIRYH